jgi:hypothetical protein
MYNFSEEKEEDRKLLMVKATNVSTFKVKKSYQISVGKKKKIENY